MTRLRMTLLMILGGATGLQACTPVDSSDLKTSGMYADFRAGRGVDGVGVSASLKTGSGVSPDVSLSAGDRFVVFVGGQSFPMTEMACDRCIPGVVRPQVALLPASAATETIRIAFERRTAASAPNSSGSLPTAHTIASPLAGQFSRNAPASRSGLQNINVTWAPIAPQDAVTVNITGCDSSFVRMLAPGTASLSFNLRTLTPVVPDVPCDVYFQVTLSRTGTVDPAFGKGGRFLAQHGQDVMVTTSP